MAASVPPPPAGGTASVADPAISEPGRRLARIGLVGYGLGGSTFHAPLIATAERLELAYVVTSSPERAAAATARYPGVAILSDVGMLLERAGELDAVVISTPNSTHVPIASAVLALDTAVVVDKPVAATASEVVGLATIAARRSVPLVPYHNRRWDSDFLTVQALLGTGALGDVHRVESRYERWQPLPPTGAARAWKRDRAPGAATGILYDLGTHLVDQAVALFGRPDTVYAEVAARRGAVDDDVFVALDYRRGPKVHLWASALAAETGPRFRLLGSQAAFTIHGMDVQEQDLASGAEPGTPGWGAPPVSAWGQLSGAGEDRPVPSVAGDYGAFYAGLADCLLDGGPPPVDIADAVTVAEITEAAVRSAAGHTVEHLRGPSPDGGVGAGPA